MFATVGAFFVTTRLKRSTPVIEQLTFRRSISPNCDGRFDAALFSFRLRRTDEVTVAIVNRDGDEVRTLAADVLLEGGRRHRFRWDGRTEARRVAPDGEYHLRVGLRRQGRSVTSGRKLFLDTVPPTAGREVRVPGLDLARRGGRRQQRDAPVRRPVPARAAAGVPDGPPAGRDWSPRRAIPDGEPTVRWNGRVQGGGRRPRGRT